MVLQSHKQNDEPAVLQPLTRHIHLFDTVVAGTSLLKDRAPLQKLEAGQKLLLQRAPDKFDGQTVLVLTGQGEKVGRIPEQDEPIAARLMDAGKLLAAEVTGVTHHSGYSVISIRICLVDF